MVYNFGKTSRARLATCHRDLQKIMLKAIRLSPVDFGVAEGHRTLEKQQQYFAEGKSKCDGVASKSKHQALPSMAVDFFPYVNGKANWQPEIVTAVAMFICGVAAKMYEGGDVVHRIRWGGNWDGDGEILTDQGFDDRPHLELVF